MKSEIIVVFDLETTGKCPASDGVVQFSAVGFLPKRERATTLISTLCKPDVDISDESTKIHGISAWHVTLSPSIEIVLWQFNIMLEHLARVYDVILAGHNSENFDLRFIDRYRPKADFKSFSHIDTCLLARRFFPNEGHKLTQLYETRLGTVENAHDAAVDCHMVARLLPWFLQESGCRSYWQLSDLAAVGQPYVVMPFGKHKSTPIEDVPKRYLRFCRDTFDDPDRDLVATFKAFLS